MGLIIYINNRFKFLIYRCERKRERERIEYMSSSTHIFKHYNKNTRDTTLNTRKNPISIICGIYYTLYII